MNDDVVKCSNCYGEVTADSDFCPHCGNFLEHAPIVACTVHLEQMAKGICIICQKFVCELCAEVRMKKLFCLEHKNVEVQEDWARIPESYDTAATKSVLESYGFQVIEEHRGVKSYYHKLFVPIPDYVNAMNALQKN